MINPIGLIRPISPIGPIGLIGLISLIGLAILLVSRLLRRRNFLQNLDSSLFLISVPQKPETAEKPNFKSEINLSEQLFSALGSLKKPFTLETAVSYIGEEIRFYLAVPKKFSGAAVQQIHGLWPEAQIEESDDYNIFNEKGFHKAGYFLQKTNFSIPIRTYEDIGDDTFKAILSNLSKVKEIGEGAAIQVIVKQASPAYKKIINKYFNLVKKGQGIRDIIKYPTSLLFIPNPQEILLPEEKKEPQTPIQVDEESKKVLEKKSSKPLFEVNIRLVTSASVEYEAESLLAGLEASFEPLSGTQSNGFRLIKPRKSAKLLFQFSFRFFAGRKNCLNAPG